MLIRYRNDYRKIALGLLSYIPGLRNMSNLQVEFSSYEENENKELLLWRDNDGHFIAIIGIECIYGVILIRHIALTPNSRNTNLLFKVLDSVQNYHADKMIMATIAGQKIINAWRKHNEKRTSN